MNTDLAIPTIHLNGTSREALVEQLCEAVHALRIAGRALAAACPNGRDYYPQGEQAIQHALSQHAARLKAVDTVIGELERIAEAIA